MAAAVASVAFGQLRPYGLNVTLDKWIILGWFCFRALGGLFELGAKSNPRNRCISKKREGDMCCIWPSSQTTAFQHMVVCEGMFESHCQRPVQELSPRMSASLTPHKHKVIYVHIYTHPFMNIKRNLTIWLGSPSKGSFSSKKKQRPQSLVCHSPEGF